MSSALLDVRGLYKSFGALRVTQNVDLELHAGDRVGLIGPNGAGKTTLLDLLTGVLTPDSGEIHLDGVPIHSMKPERRVALGLARTHQITTLLPDTSARENVALAVAERERISWRMFFHGRAWRRCLDQASEFLAEVGADSAGERPVRELGYGEQRLLEIAVAMALRPRVLLLDEPAAGVPSSEVPVIHRALCRLPRDIAILLIEHDMDLVFSFASEIIVLASGSVLRRGAPDAIAADPRVRAAYFGQRSP